MEINIFDLNQQKSGQRFCLQRSAHTNYSATIQILVKPQKDRDFCLAKTAFIPPQTKQKSSQKEITESKERAYRRITQGRREQRKPTGWLHTGAEEQNKHKGKTKAHERKHKTKEKLVREKRSHSIPEYGFQPWQPVEE